MEGLQNADESPAGVYVPLAQDPPGFCSVVVRTHGDPYAMLPVVSGPAETRRQIFLYSLVLVGISLLLALWGGAGTIYLAAALVLGGGFVYYAARLWLSDSAKPAAALFRYSIVYLALLFSAIALDALVR